MSIYFHRQAVNPVTDSEISRWGKDKIRAKFIVQVIKFQSLTRTDVITPSPWGLPKNKLFQKKEEIG